MNHTRTHAKGKGTSNAVASSSPLPASHRQGLGSIPPLNTLDLGLTDMISAQNERLIEFARSVQGVLLLSSSGLIQITGYYDADQSGSMQLAQERAGLAKGVLVALGLPKDRITAGSFDGSLPGIEVPAGLVRIALHSPAGSTQRERFMPDPTSAEQAGKPLGKESAVGEVMRQNLTQLGIGAILSLIGGNPGPLLNKVQTGMQIPLGKDVTLQPNLKDPGIQIKGKFDLDDLLKRKR